eukprot:CAMPEP_0116131176 /NCGR_PEP_ID=MMETSP0329-20121206/8867_1 /TAXON_ID=697910 /ORGANISM="Pseudo-nitzschia arenysensis, Strain B593" /LENGTH=458 /DNA_ID=CAMNT_0003625591 /DNA_START=99 /DNA_END=1475 /DNA_ORIENTATION=+
MRALNIIRLLTLAIFLNHGEAADAADQEGKEMTEEGRKLMFGYGYDPYSYDSYFAFTAEPTPQPTFKPTPYPSPRPTPSPTGKPTYSPTHYPSPRPTPHPTPKPSPRPTRFPTGPPVPYPTRKPTPNPTPMPTPGPTIRPTPSPTIHPTLAPSRSPTLRPTPSPTFRPTPAPTPRPTPIPTTLPPTERPTPRPTNEPSEYPTQTEEPSEDPTQSQEPSENPTSTTSFSGSSTLSFADGCFGTETILDIICAGFNSNVLGNLCREVRARGLEGMFRDCNRRLTLFAPNNGAWDDFLSFFNDDFFTNTENFPLRPIQGDLILRPSHRDLEQEERSLQDVNQAFKNNVLSQVLGFHTTNGVFRVQNLECGGSLFMSARGNTTTVCENTAYSAQRGVCNGRQPTFSQVNIVAANGIIHVLDNVMIPSPNNTLAGCDLIGPFDEDGDLIAVETRAIFITESTP